MKTIEAIHKASQYLATLGKSFVSPKDDDSHTSLYWNKQDASLVSQPLDDEGLAFTLNHKTYSLDLIHPMSGLGASFPLSGARHFDLVNWIGREARFCGLEDNYEFSLHYDLPYEDELNDHTVFPKPDYDQLDQICNLRSLADGSLQAVKAKFDQTSEVRVWPHHFDTGLMIYPSSGKPVSFGLGMSIPDSMLDDFYFYLSGYNDDGQISPDSTDELELGEWKLDSWKGAVLKSSQINSQQVVTKFFEGAMSQFS